MVAAGAGEEEDDSSLLHSLSGPNLLLSPHPAEIYADASMLGSANIYASQEHKNVARKCSDQCDH